MLNNELILIKPIRNKDERGFFSEIYSQRRYKELGVDVDFLQENHCCLAVASPGNKGFQNLALVIDGPPQVMSFSIYLHENFVQMPSPVGVITGRRMKSFLPDLIGK